MKSNFDRSLYFVNYYTLIYLIWKRKHNGLANLQSSCRDVVSLKKSNFDRLSTQSLVFVAAVDALALIVAQELERDALAAVATPLLNKNLKPIIKDRYKQIQE
jgi:hypothetical protein